MPCESGTYSGGGKDSCERCLAGTACPTIFAEIIIICSEGTYSEDQSMVSFMYITFHFSFLVKKLSRQMNLKEK